MRGIFLDQYSLREQLVGVNPGRTQSDQNIRIFSARIVGGDVQRLAGRVF